MTRRLDPILRRPRLSLGVGVAVGGIAVATGAIFALKLVAPVVSLSVVYLIPVLSVSTYWGAWLGVAASVGSALAFNFFFLDPVGRFTIADSRNWVALLAFLVVALVTSRIAESARARAVEAEERRREADLAAEMAQILLGGPGLSQSLPLTARRLAEVLSASSASIELGEVAVGARRSLVPLTSAGMRIGTLVLPSDLPATQRARVRQRVVPALESLLAAALASERLQAEVVETASLRRSDEMKTALLRSVSHDLRTPVTTVLAGVRAMRSTSAGDPDREQMEADIAEAATRLSLLIDKLLDLARLQAGSAEPSRTWCSIEEVVREAADAIDPAGHRLQVSMAADLPLVRADPVQLERVFANLFENALRYGGAEPASVRARAVDGRIVVRVVDRGPGVLRHDQERIFAPFYRAETAARTSTGSGLGLAIAKGFVEANDGTIRVESLPGQGATFVIEFPVEPIDDTAALPTGQATSA